MVGVPPEKGAFVQIPTVVFGIAIEDPETARLTKRVLFISSFMAVLACTHYILRMFDSGNPLYLLLLALALIVPLCGYVGAKTKRVCYITIFTLCNLFQAICMFLSLGFLISWTFLLVKAKSWCSAHSSASSYDGPHSGYIHWYAGDADDCEDIMDLHWATMVLSILVGTCGLILNVAAVAWGKALQSHHQFGNQRLPEIAAAQQIRTEPLLVQQIGPVYDDAVIHLVTDAVVVDV